MESFGQAFQKKAIVMGMGRKSGITSTIITPENTVARSEQYKQSVEFLDSAAEHFDEAIGQLDENIIGFIKKQEKQYLDAIMFYLKRKEQEFKDVLIKLEKKYDEQDAKDIIIQKMRYLIKQLESDGMDAIRRIKQHDQDYRTMRVKVAEIQDD